MPQEANKRPTNRWEGTHTYGKTDPRRPRTAAQVREEALRRIKEDREKRNASSDRRRSLPTPTGANKGPSTPTNISQVTKETPEAEVDMPGSNKKKRQASGKPDETPRDETEGIDPALKAFLVSIKEDINKSTDAAVDRIDRRIDEHARCIDELKQAVSEVDKKVDEVEKRIEVKVKACVRQEVARTGTTKAGSTNMSTARYDRQQEAYNFCRRSLKIWPITGEDLLDSLKVFLSTKLKFTDEKIGLLGHVEVTRAQTRAAKDRNEVIATFESRVERDCVKAAGINLAGQTEVGMGIHVPGHLMDNLVALNGVGFGIKQRQKDVKRAIKFNDVNRDIYMDICIDGQWKKITPTKARQVAKQVPTLGGSTSLSLEDLSGLVRGQEGAASAPVVILDDDDQ